MNPSKQTIADVATIARNAIDRMIELESNKLDIRRKWVGLTYEEESDLIRLAHNHAGIRFYIQAAEAKLKKINNGT